MEGVQSNPIEENERKWCHNTKIKHSKGFKKQQQQKQNKKQTNKTLSIPSIHKPSGCIISGN